ncbi:hypothetical protein MC885_015360 [Smutsia gigantea]|nr:hypothetical protein MC885_015360 [Smutsia gigantea]
MTTSSCYHTARATETWSHPGHSASGRTIPLGSDTRRQEAQARSSSRIVRTAWQPLKVSSTAVDSVQHGCLQGKYRTPFRPDAGSLRLKHGRPTCVVVCQLLQKIF